MSKIKMKCEYCNAEMSAGDISLFPDKNGDIEYKVICPNCDKIQSSIVKEKDGMIYVITEEKRDE